MFDNLKMFQKVIKEINVLIKEKEVNDNILQEFKRDVEGINIKMDITNNNINKLESEKNKLNHLKNEQEIYRIKGWIYTVLPPLFALMFSPIIFNILNISQAIIMLSTLSIIISLIGSKVGFEEYNIIKKELKKLPNINNDLQMEYKIRNELKYDLTFYTYKEKEIKKEQKEILNNIKKLLEEYSYKTNIKNILNTDYSISNIQDEIETNKTKIKK